VDVVKTDAQILSQGAKNMSYVPPPAADGTARPVVPCVRLGTMMDAAMPEKGKGIDPSFITKLEATIEAFRDEGVYVCLDGNKKKGTFLREHIFWNILYIHDFRLGWEKGFLLLALFLDQLSWIIVHS